MFRFLASILGMRPIRVIQHGKIQMVLGMSSISAMLSLASIQRYWQTTARDMADDGEVEDFIVTIRPEEFDDEDLAVATRFGNGSDDIVIRLNGSNVEVYDNTASLVLASHPLAKETYYFGF